MLFTMILAINGIRIILNTRCGGIESYTAFKSIPKEITVSSGFLGCDKLCENDFSYISKIVFLFPCKVLVAEEQLDRFGFVYKVYPDTHKSSKSKEN